MSGTKVPRDPNLSPELRRFLDELSRTLDSLGATSPAPINSPTFTGDPKAPTPTPGDNDTSLATTAFVAAAITAAIAAIPSHFTRVSSGSVGTGATFPITNIPAHDILTLQLAGVSHGDGSSQNLQIELSINNGSAWSSAVNLTQSSFSAASVVAGTITISQDGSGNYIISADVSGNTGGSLAMAGTVNAMRLSWTAGSFDAGSHVLWAMD